MSIPPTHGTSIPPGEFSYSYASDEWGETYLHFTAEYNKPHHKDARMLAQFVGLPKSDMDLLKLVRGIRLLRDELRSGLAKAGDVSSKLASERLSRIKETLDDYTLALGEKVASALIHGDDSILPNLGKTLNSLPAIGLTSLQSFLGNFDGGERDTLPRKILGEFSQLCQEWFPNCEGLPMLTKAALKERVLGHDPSDSEKREFRAEISRLGFSKLPERRRGKKR